MLFNCKSSLKIPRPETKKYSVTLHFSWLVIAVCLYPLSFLFGLWSLFIPSTLCIWLVIVVCFVCLVYLACNCYLLHLPCLSNLRLLFASSASFFLNFYVLASLWLLYFCVPCLPCLVYGCYIFLCYVSLIWLVVTVVYLNNFLLEVQILSYINQTNG